MTNHEFSTCVSFNKKTGFLGRPQKFGVIFQFDLSFDVNK